MKNIIAISIITVLIIASWIPTTNSDTPMKTTTLYVGGIGPGNYTTIQSAINASISGDTIFVYVGTYNCNIHVKKTLTLIGENKNDTIIAGNGYSEVVNISKDNVSINGFKINNGGLGVCIYNVNNTTASNNIISNNWYGLYIYNSSFTKINNNLINNNTNAISYFGSCNNNSMNKNKIFNNTVGIHLGYFDGISKKETFHIVNNTLLNNGLFLQESNNNVIKNNTINGKKLVYLHNSYDMAIEEDAGEIILVHCDNITIINNDLSYSDCGLILINSSWNNIENNSINSNYYVGIMLIDKCMFNDFKNNHFSDTREGPGIQIGLNSNSNSFINNTFQNDGMVVSNSFNNIFVNNSINGKPLIVLENINDNIVLGEVGQLIMINCDNITVENKTIFSTFIGIYCFNCSSCKIINNVISLSSIDLHSGIYLYNSTKNIINNNQIINSKHGIFLFQSPGNKISNQSMYNNTVSIILRYESNNNILENNNILDSQFGIWAWDETSENTIINNNLSSNQNSIYLWMECNHNFIFNNNITNNDIGVKFENVKENILNFNSIKNNRFGIKISTSTTNEISYCNLFQNDYAIHITDSSIENIIYHNNFIDNFQNGYDNTTNYWHNQSILEGNFWDDYTGIDADFDGIGDTPYNITGGSNQDLYPLMDPWNVTTIDPTAYFTYTPTHPIVDVVVEFNATLSYDSDGTITMYEWDWNNDGIYDSTGIISTYSWSTAGSYQVCLRLTDNDNFTDIFCKIVTINIDVPGDMNGDSRLNAADIRYLAMYLNGDPSYSPLYADGDVNSDGRVNAADVRYLAMYLNGNPAYSPLYP